MLWLGLALSQKNYTWVMYNSCQNILAHYYYSSAMYLKEKRTKNCEHQNNCKEM